MFGKLATLALVLPFVSGFTINALQGATSTGQVTVTWSATTTDPQSFSIELYNQAFNDVYAIANDVSTAQGTLTLTLPDVPMLGGYTLQAINPSNVNDVYATSGQFSIGAATSSSTSAASTTSSATSTSSLTLSTPSTTATTTTTPLSSLSSATTLPATSAASSAASSTPSSFNSGAAPLKVPGMVPVAALLLSAVAGAAMVF